MALVLAVALALTAPAQVRHDHALDIQPAESLATSSLAVEREFASFLYDGGALAVKAASDYRASSNSSFVNASCVLSVLALKGSATPSDCPGESFPALQLSDERFAADHWQAGYPALHTGPFASTAAILSLQAYDYNASFTGFNATLAVNDSYPGSDAALDRTYNVSVLVALSAVSPPPYG